jgi:uncharacterized protein YcfJ
MKRTLLAVALVASALPAAAQITLYSREAFDGRNVTIDNGERNLAREGFNDRASSAIVRGGRFEVCEDENFRGRCMVLRPGQYPSLGDMGMDKSISSVRALRRDANLGDQQRFAPPPPVAYDYRRREDERLFDADVVDVRAVYGAGEQRCWMERQEAPMSDRNVPGAIAGAVIGGILGHQVGSGRGNDAATAGGAVVGGLIGSQVGGGTTYGTREVQRCEQARGRPQYWDVTYRFRGQDRTVQMTRPPGQTITVNRDGEPRERG